MLSFLQMIKHKFPITILAIVILVGIVNSVVIEPAICLAHEDAVSQQQQNDPCCVICHPMYHQAIMPSAVSPIFTMTHFVNSERQPKFFLLEVPTRSIFHPPLRFSF